jgi:hypothetical protein
MTPEERQLLSQLFDRIRGASQTPRDREAEAFIAEAVREQPYAPYLMAQTVIVQEEALKEAGRRIEALESELKAKASAGSGSFLGGIGRSVFGAGSVPSVGGRSGQADAPRGSPWGASPGAPQPQGGQQFNNPLVGQQGRGGSFLQTAMATAAGVAGGALLAHGLQSLWGGQAGNPQALAGTPAEAASAATEGGMIPDIFGPEDGGVSPANFDAGEQGFDLPDDEPGGGDEWV